MSNEITSDDKNMAVLAHVGGLFFSFVPALIIWLLKKDSSPYLAEQAREALNFQITVMLGYLCAGILMWLLIGFLLFPVIYIANLVLCIIAAIAVSKGEAYFYPFSLRLIS